MMSQLKSIKRSFKSPRLLLPVLLYSTVVVSIIILYLYFSRKPVLKYTEVESQSNNYVITGDKHLHADDGRKKILILADMKYMKIWTGLDQASSIWSFLKPDYTGKANLVYRGSVECNSLNSQGHNSTIELTFSPNYTDQMHGKDAVILNVVPWTLQANMVNLLEDNIQQHHDQLRIFYSMETPLWIHRTFKYRITQLPVHGIWSYYADSQIHMPYGYYKNAVAMMNSTSQDLENLSWIKSKTKLVAWMGSNCYHTFWPRMAFVEKLQKYLMLDTFGQCGNLTCEPNSIECNHLISSYKFYLSFESAECEDYLTEKFWTNALYRGVVPIVYGAPREAYEKLAPPNSFIYAGDFKSVKSLAKYILKLDTRPDLYVKFFEWQYHGSFVNRAGFRPEKFCDVLPLIEQLQRGNLVQKPVSTFAWFNTCRYDPLKYEHFLSLEAWKPW